MVENYVALGRQWSDLNEFRVLEKLSLSKSCLFSMQSTSRTVTYANISCIYNNQSSAFSILLWMVESDIIYAFLLFNVRFVVIFERFAKTVFDAHEKKLWH